MGQNEAKITLGVDGASAAKSALKGVSGELKALGIGASRLAIDFSRAANDAKKIDFGEAANKFKAFDEQLTRMSIRSGREVEALRIKFTNFGRSVGVTGQEFAKSVRAFQNNTFAGVDESAEAMRALGTYADDTDRSLEEMGELGDALYNKLGVPAKRIGIEIQNIRSAAEQVGYAGGFMALERTLTRLAPLMAKFEGGTRRAAAAVAVIGKGYSRQEDAENVVGSVFSMLDRFDALDVIRTLRKQTRNAKYTPKVFDPQRNRWVWKREVPQLLQKAFLKSKNPEAAALRAAHGDFDVVQAFLYSDLSKIGLVESQMELREDIDADYKAGKVNDRIMGRDPVDKRLIMYRPGQHPDSHLVGGGQMPGYWMYGARPTGESSQLSGTAYGRRRDAELAREQLDQDIGQVVTSLQDERKRNLTAGQAAAIDTVADYAGPNVGAALQVMGAAHSAAQPRGAGEIGQLRQSIDRLNKSIQGMPSDMKTKLEDAKVNWNSDGRIP